MSPPTKLSREEIDFPSISRIGIPFWSTAVTDSSGVTRFLLSIIIVRDLTKKSNLPVEELS